ncbi:MAG: hypothetical protein HQL31_05425 [Planctomycetes bacterium]|nr:hypothetical protein [Planctomycetota bacterium]
MRENALNREKSGTLERLFRKDAWLAGFALLLVLCLSLACGDSDETVATTGVSGRVTDGTGSGVASAKVYLIPTASINKTAITGANVIDTTSRPAEAYDEPLEDAVRIGGSGFLSAVTDAAGSYAISSDIPTGDYYIYVEPAAADAAHLPGGDKCRIAMSTANFEGGTVNVELSGNTPSSATFIGSSACVTCHADYAGMKFTAHKSGISVPGTAGGLQDRTNFPNFEDSTNWMTFKSVSSYTLGKKLTVGDYDASRGFDKFKVYEDSSKVTTTYANVFLWKDRSDSKYKITIVNVINGADVNSPLTLPVELTYGGTVYKQRYLVKVPDAFATATGTTLRKGHYPLLQYQAYPGISTGSESNYDRTKSKWRDYHLDWWWNASGNVLKAPSASNTFEAKCASCHFTGFNNGSPVAINATTNEYLADAADDVNGAYDIDGDGSKDEVNIGCESCHGAGSAHQAANKAESIIKLSSITPSRASMVCGTCHDRSSGIGSASTSGLQQGDMLFNSNNLLPKPGMSRNEIVGNYMTRPGPGSSDLWSNDHSKSHHQQYADFLKSKHYRNDRQLVVCSDCHDVHASNTLKGAQEYAHNLKGNPADPTGDLCMRCHNIEYTTHMEQKTAAQHRGIDTACSDCHMPRTAKSGAGMLGAKHYGTTSPSAANTYLMGDISSHVFDYVDKLASGVAGVSPGSAMPAPYTNKCGDCHQVDGLVNAQPQ